MKTFWLKLVCLVIGDREIKVASVYTDTVIQSWDLVMFEETDLSDIKLPALFFPTSVSIYRRYEAL